MSNKRKRNLFLNEGVSRYYGADGLHQGDATQQSVRDSALYNPDTSNPDTGSPISPFKIITQDYYPVDITGFNYTRYLTWGNKVFTINKFNKKLGSNQILAMNLPCLQDFLFVGYLKTEEYTKQIYETFKDHGVKYGVTRLNKDDPLEDIDIDALIMFKSHKDIVPIFDWNSNMGTPSDSIESYMNQLMKATKELKKSLKKSSGFTKGLGRTSSVLKTFNSVASQFITQIEDTYEESQMDDSTVQTYKKKLGFMNYIFNDYFMTLEPSLTKSYISFLGIIHNDQEGVNSHHGKLQFKGFNSDISKYTGSSMKKSLQAKLRNKSYETGKYKAVAITTSGLAETQDELGDGMFNGGKVGLTLSKNWDENKKRYTYQTVTITCSNSHDEDSQFFYNIYNSSNSKPGNMSTSEYRNSILSSSEYIKLGKVFQSNHSVMRKKERNTMKRHKTKKKKWSHGMVDLDQVNEKYNSSKSMYLYVNQ